MNKKPFPRWMALPLLAVLAMISCSSLVPQASPPATETIQTEPEDTATVEVIPTATQKIQTETAAVILTETEIVSAPTAAPTRRYFPGTSQSSPGGTCGAGGIVSEITGDVYDCAVVFTDDSLIQFIILKNGQEIGKGEGVQSVFFSVDQNGNNIYTKIEETAAYCIFGGNGPCAPWVFEDNFYKWQSGGQPVESGIYTVSISPSLDDLTVNLFWSVDVTVTLP